MSNGFPDTKCSFKGQLMWMNQDIYLPSFEIVMREPKIAKASSDFTFIIDINASLRGMLILKENLACKFSAL